MIARVYRSQWISACLSLGLLTPVCGAAPPAAAHELQGYYHTVWSSDNGLGGIQDIQQAPDGFLWLTTSTGIFRFDGVRFQSMDEMTNGAVHNQDLEAAFLASDGSAWFNTRNSGLDRWKDNKLVQFSDRRCTPARKYGGIAEDRDGSLWILASAGLFHLSHGTCEQIGSERGLPGGLASAFLMDRKGTLWVKTRTGELLLLPRGEPKFKVSPHGGGAGTSNLYDSYLHEAPDGAVWISDKLGLRRVTDANGAYDLSVGEERRPQSTNGFGDFTFAADGSMWAVNTAGILHFKDLSHLRVDENVDPAEGESVTAAQGLLSSNVVWRLLVDREGTLWVATNAGLDQLRRSAVSTVALPHLKEVQLAIAPGDNGSIWIGSRLLPLTHVERDGRLTTFSRTEALTCLRRDPKGIIWSAGSGKTKLWRASFGELLPVHYPHDDVELITSLAVDRNDGLWISTWGPTIERREGTAWLNQNQAIGRKPGVLGAMRGDDSGNVWIAHSNRLVEWDGNAYHQYAIPGDSAVSVTTIAIQNGNIWMGGAGGVALFRNGKFHRMHWKDEQQVGKVSGLVETRSGELWINGFSGVARVSATELAKWLNDPSLLVPAERFNALDGLPGLSEDRYPEPSIIETLDGRVWFATAKGIGWIDPQTLDKNRNRIPPPVAIFAVVASGRAFVGQGNLTLPAYTQNLEIDYTALSLVIPERVKFRYKLDGVDQDWQEVGTRRQTYYTKLRPGTYRFHVIASNNDGVWNETGANLAFSIAPAWYQTNRFLALCIFTALAMAWLLYRLRVRQVARAISARFDERLDERTRIARELHDTFLQTIQGSKLVADDALDPSRDPARMRHAMEQLSVWLGRATEEGRAALNSLRTSTTETNDLAAAFRRAVEECHIHSSLDASFSVVGETREIHPIVRDEIYRIGYEAIRNACVHSQASRLHVELTYAEDLSLRVSDNGVGIDPVVAGQGKAGHFGLQGMRERANRIVGKLTIASATGSGTEVSLVVPGGTIYRKAPGSGSNLSARIKSLVNRVRGTND